MKILRVTGDLYPAVVGGVGIHTHELSKWQVINGHQVTVFTNNQKKAPACEFIDGYEVKKFPVRLSLFGNSISPDLIPAIIRSRKKFDIIHAHSHLFFPTNICVGTCLIGSAPLIITNHGLISASAPLWLNKLYTRSITKISFEIADCVLCYTDIEKEKLHKFGVPTEKIRVIHNGVDTELFSPRKTGGKKKYQQLLWVGRFVPGKGVNNLIEAFQKIVKDFENTRLILVGEGPLKSTIDDQIEKLGLKNNVEIYDYWNNSKLPELYNESDIFILPSLMEGVPRTILEAMACGIPVIITELPHLREIVNGAGLIVPQGDSEKLTCAISQLLNNKEMALQLGKAGRQKISQQFSWQDTVEKTLNVYKEFV
ncbi:MAG: glycosyltransferase family 4 protein [Methanoregula sp.]